MDKKGTYAADTAPFYVVFGIVINVLFIVFMVLVYSYASKSAEIPQGLERYIFIQRFFNSEECFTYSNNARAYPGILDWNKFSDENKDNVMAKCFNIAYDTETQKKAISFKLTLKIDEDTKQIVTTPNWGLNFGFKEQETKKVLVYYNNKLQKAKLVIEVWDV